MKKLSFIFAFGILLTAFWGCEKEDTTTNVFGQVIEAGSNKPVEGVKAVLMAGQYNGISTGTFSYYPIDTVLTDKDGRYAYKDLKINSHHIIRFFKDKYSSDNTSVNGIDVELNKTINPVTKIFAFGFLKIRVLQVTDDYHQIKVDGPWDAAALEDLFWESIKKVDTTFTKKVKGGQKAFMWSSAYNNLTKTSGYIKDTIYIKPHDTTYYEIKF
jgi:hypothetical protein